MADMKLALLVLLIMVTVTPIIPHRCDSSRPRGTFHNNWHQSFYAYCHSGYSVSQWFSYYRRCQGDRLYYLRCRRGPPSGRYIQFCAWSGYINNPGQSHYTGCANHGYVAGIISMFYPPMSDRRFRLRCCRVWGYKPGLGYRQYRRTNCRSTWYQNSFGQTVLNYQVPSGYTLTGVASYYNSFYKDRRWRFSICQMRN